MNLSLTMRALPLAACIMIMAGALGACKDEKSAVGQIVLDTDSLPTMTTSKVTTLISDSGQIRYRITTVEWLVYDETETPTWKFPKGIYLEKFDRDFAIDATVQCDSATYFSQRSLWRLDGNVNILNTNGEKFLTQQLFWDQRLNKIYSDSFIHIERADRTIEGLGFESNDRMTRYSIKQPTGIFPAGDFAPGRQPATASDAATDDPHTSAAENRPAPPAVPPPPATPIVKPAKPQLPHK